MSIREKLNEPKADIAALAREAIDDPTLLPELFEELKAPKGTLRYRCEKVLRCVSEQRPRLIYPFFDRYVSLLDSDNSFLKWGAILTIGNLAVEDRENRFDSIFTRFFAAIKGPAMITASNIIIASAKIAVAQPRLADCIVDQILKVERAEFERHGSPSRECRNVVLGRAIDAIDTLFDHVSDRDNLVRFVTRQLDNPRPAVVKKAKRFLRRHGA